MLEYLFFNYECTIVRVFGVNMDGLDDDDDDRRCYL